MLTKQQFDILENAYEILDLLRNCSDFNQSHDLTLSDGCRVLSDFLDYVYQKERDERNQSLRQVVLANLESFQNL